jgi:hypothetical protein
MESQVMSTKKLTTKVFVSRANEIHNNKYDYSQVEYTNSHAKVKIICSIHRVFEQKSYSHLQGIGCSKCVNNSKLSTEEWIAKAIESHGYKFDYSLVEYTGYDRKVKIICPIHGVFEQSPHNHLTHGCKICKSSKGESYIRSFLLDNNISFIQEHRFVDCRDKYPIPFDFYLPDHNICIEYDGIQHFVPTSFSSDKSDETCAKNFELVKYRDELKNNFCIKNNITLTRIPYTEFKNIDTLLSSIVS